MMIINCYFAFLAAPAIVMIIVTTHSLHLKQATAGLIRMMMMSTLLDFTKSARGVWKLGQDNHVGGMFFCSQDFVVLLWMQSVK